MENENYTALSWDSEITDGESTYFLPAVGEWRFTVKEYEKGYHSGTGKIKECPKATVTLVVTDGDKKCEIKEVLLLHTSMEWKLADFFRCLGLKKQGEKLKMEFDKITGLSGTARIRHEEWTNKNGETKISAKIDKFLDPTVENTPLGHEISFESKDLPF